MAKKIDIKRTLGSPTPSFNADAIEEMTRMVHTKKVEEAVAAKVSVAKTEQPATEKITPKKTTDTAPVVSKAKKAQTSDATGNAAMPLANKRGRKPNPPATDERMVRVSVDLPESIFIQLKVKVIQEKTDMKTWAWRLIEKELSK
jgi:hypothetical protein